MNMKLKMLLIGLISVISFDGYSQDEDCLKFLSDYNQFLNHLSAPEKDNTFEFSYSITNQLNDHSAPVNDNVSMIMAEGKLQYRSEYMDVFQDTLHSFMVLKSQKLIVFNNSSKEVGAYQDISRITMFRDSILEHCIVMECYDTILENSGKQKYIQLAYDKTLRKSLSITSQRLYFNLDNGFLKKLVTLYTSDHEYKSTTILFHEMNTRSKRKISKSAYEMIFAKNDHLVAEYRNYRVMDNRVSKKTSN